MSESIFNSAIKMQTFASEFANKVSKGTVVALIGNLGAGKTTFTQGFARGLGIDDHVISPTFKLVSEYQGDQMLYHVDCYRLDQPKDFLNIGGEQFLNPADGIALIEWAERIEPFWSDDWIFIYFYHIENKLDSRKIRITGI